MCCRSNGGRFISLREPPIQNQVDGEKVAILSNQGTGLRDRYDNTGDLTDLKNALEYFQKALHLTTQFSPEKAGILNNLGNGLLAQYECTGNLYKLDQAIEHCQQAVKLTPANSKDKALRLNSLAECLQTRYERTADLTELNQGLGYLHQAVSTYEVPSEQKVVIYSNLSYGLCECYVRTGNLADLNRAVKHAQQAVSTISQISPDTKAKILNVLGYALRLRYEKTSSLLDLGDAIDSHSRAVDLSNEAYPSKAKFTTNLGVSLFLRAKDDRRTSAEQQADLAQAQACFEQAMLHSSPEKFPTSYRLAAFNLGQLHYHAGQFAEAVTALEAAHQAVDYLRSGSQSAVVRQKTAADNVDLYRYLVASCLELGAFRKALEYAAAGKGQALVDTLASGAERDATLGATWPGFAQEWAKVAALREQLAAKRAALTGEGSTARGDEALSEALRETTVQELQRLQTEQAQQWAALEKQFPALTATQKAPPLTAPQAQELAQALGATLVEYFEHQKGWGAFVITATTLDYHPLPKVTPKLLDKLVLWVEGLTRTLGFALSPDSYKRLDEMYAAFFEPFSATLALEQPLILAPFNRLHLLPLNAARKPASKRYLLEDFPLLLVPSLGALHAIWQQAQLLTLLRAGKQLALLSVAYPGEQGSANYLPNVLPEAATIAQHFSPMVTSLHEGAAQVADVLKLAPQHKVMHLGCHGYFDLQHPKDSGLLLAGGQWLTVQHILSELNLRQTALLTLGACVSGKADLQKGDEMVGLAQASLIAGATAVVASQWHVHDGATRALFEAFYAGIAKGATPTQALREATAVVRAQQAWKHPYYWAAFQVHGMPQTPSTEPPPLAEASMVEIGRIYQQKDQLRGAKSMQPEEIIMNAAGTLDAMAGDPEAVTQALAELEPEERAVVLEIFSTLPTQFQAVANDAELLELAEHFTQLVEGVAPLWALFGIGTSAAEVQAEQKKRAVTLASYLKAEDQTQRTAYVAEHCPALINDTEQLTEELDLGVARMLKFLAPLPEAKEKRKGWWAKALAKFTK